MSTISLRAFCFQHQITDQEAAKAKVVDCKTQTGATYPALFIEAATGNYFLTSSKKYDHRTAEELYAWIKEHGGKDLAVAFYDHTDAHPDRSGYCLCLKSDAGISVDISLF